jgi:dolichyl-phosphate beta-glucosyltransferase
VSRPRLSVVIPVYNEAVAIAGALADASRRLEALVPDGWEIVVVDNHSTDPTREEIAPLLADERIRLLVNDVNRGKGYSVRRGVSEARGELILHCDADCVPSFASLPAMLALLDEGGDVVIGSRLADGAAVARRQPLRRRIVGRAFVGLCRRILSEPTRDLYCGFKLWRAEAAHAAYERSRLDGWVFDAETIALARALGFELREIGIAWTDRDGSRLSMPRVIVPAVRDLLRARAHVRREAARGPAAPALEPVG